MIIKSFDVLEGMVRNSKRRKVAIAAAHDAHTLEAALKCHEEEYLDYVLIGKKDLILEIGHDLGYEINPDDVINTETDRGSAFEAVRLIREGKADFIQKGLLHTSILLHEVVTRDTGIRTGRLMSHLTLLNIPGRHKICAITDAGMNIHPDLPDKKDILMNAVDFFHKFGYKKPKVAALCSVEVINPRMQDTVDAGDLKELALHGEIEGCIIEGPISLDLAESKESAKIKGYESPVTGDVDIFLVPDITTGNIMGKSILYFSKGIMAGAVLGAKCPIALNSRSASFKEKYYSLLMCAIIS